jgi:hypothetical protein
MPAIQSNDIQHDHRRWLRRLESIRAEVMTTPAAELQQVSDEQLERLRMIAMREEH